MKVDLYEVNTHWFIVKIWLEEGGEEGSSIIWRGEVSHILDSKRQYVRSLDNIATFIATYLSGLGVQLDCEPHVQQIIVKSQGGTPMAEIKWKLDLTVTDGPKFPLDKTLTVDSYERMDFELRAGYWREVEIEPDQDLCLLMIKRSDPDPKFPTDATKLYYTISGGTSSGGTSSGGTSSGGSYSGGSYSEGTSSGGSYSEGTSSAQTAKGTTSGETTSRSQSGGTTHSENIPLESVHLLIGPGIHRLMKAPPTRLKFTNDQEQAVTITVLLGRRVAEAQRTGQTP